MEVFFARIGLTARGIVYLLMGLLAYLLAGRSHAEVDQGSVLDKVLLRPGIRGTSISRTGISSENPSK